ncbi:hypothetical protein [Methanobacterium sp. ACI-7]|uniref:hypothetical protein n=1 Tax=unclassified Methanobacterium TaxID=2627676 RepID=UPI0039C363E3
MINIVITAFGVILIIGGFYAMSFGFSTPPSISLFFIGLILTVIGAMSVIIFGSKIDTAELKAISSKKKSSNSKKAKDLPKPAIKKTEIPESPKKIQPKIVKKPKESGIRNLINDRKKPQEDKKQVLPKKIEPKKIEPKKVTEESKKPIPIAENIEKPKKIRPIAKKPVNEEEPVKRKTPSFVSKPSENKEKPKFKPSFTMGRNIDSSNKTSDDQYVKNRLDKLKENYIKNASDIENLIEERLDSFKGTINQIKSESKDPSIIWSFDAGDVQGTMQETILKANNKILMMYPWIRNIDVSVLKRFMETESKMIIQEASLDDDASVELIKLLKENNVKIRTMPHVHTIAIVSDEDNGLIISTDPIYESYEVGVVYKDQKSIEEIERMFEEAWELSQEVDLGIT